MRRVVLLVAALVLGAVGAPAPPVGAASGAIPAQQPGGSPPTGADGVPLPPPTTLSTGTPPADLTVDDSELADRLATEGMVVVAEKAALVELLGAAAVAPPPLDPVIEVVLERTDLAEQPRDEQVALLRVLRVDGDDIARGLEDEGIPLSREVIESLTGPSDDQLAAIEAGQADVVNLGPYLTALDDLELRNGRAETDDSPRVRDGQLLSTAVRAAYLRVESGDPPDEAPEDPAPSTTAPPEVAPADEPVVPSASDDTPWLPWLLAGLVVVAVAVGGVLASRRRQPSVAGAQFDELLEVSRTLALARTTGDVERIGAEQAARLLGGAEATTGAVVHRGPGGLQLGHETRDGVLVPDRLGDGLLRRVVETGQPVSGVVDHEPALRHLPAALVAVPVIGDGRVNGVALVVRSPDRPFAEAEVELLAKLGPITAAALDSARHNDDATSASLTDPLTLVGNRRKLEQDLPAVLLGATGPTAVVMVDLDHFKAVNDEHGHPAGDQLLRQVAQGLQGVLRPGDGVYRYGGEEFAMVLDGATVDEAVVVAERAREALRTSTFDLGGGVQHRNTASLGVAATAGPDDLDGLGLIARADRGLYRAKEAGRDRVVVVDEDGAGPR